MLRKHMDGMSASGTMLRTRFGCGLGAANAGWIDLSVDAPLLFQLKRDVEHLSAEEQFEIARRDPGICLELGRRLVRVGPDEEGRRVLLGAAPLLSCRAPLLARPLWWPSSPNPFSRR
jgi:hypothetical protein